MIQEELKNRIGEDKLDIIWMVLEKFIKKTGLFIVPYAFR
jgi:hypothetical protein